LAGKIILYKTVFMKTITFIFLVLLSFSSFASVKEVKKIFESTFIDYYVAARCGDNIMRLVNAIDEARLDLYPAKIITIENGGFSVFGMVNAEYARQGGRLNPNAAQDGFRNLPGERNWYHHVILDYDGYIFDYDFGNHAQVLKTKAYMEKMFLDEKTRSEGGEFFVGREEKLKKYKITILEALTTLQARRNRERSPEGVKTTLENYLLNTF
jgi:hypothetical protein